MFGEFLFASSLDIIQFGMICSILVASCSSNHPHQQKLLKIGSQNECDRISLYIYIYKPKVYLRVGVY